MNKIEQSFSNESSSSCAFFLLFDLLSISHDGDDEFRKRNRSKIDEGRRKTSQL